MRILKGRPFNPGNKQPIDAEERIEDVKFNVYKFNQRPKPADKRKTVIITNFSEFGCESIALHYCIPKILRMYPGAYVVAVGWYGREYLYRHLVDEYWEIKEEHQWLREYSRAFTHNSKNLLRIERGLAEHGQVLSGAYFGNICLGNTCRSCKHFWGNKSAPHCPQCNSTDIDRSLFADIPNHKKDMVKIPTPSPQMMEEAKKYVPDGKRMVGIFARGRTCYGRNLPPEFYSKLIGLLEGLGYGAIWLGEKQSTIPCPDERVVDFSRMPESQNLELTLAIISRLEFTVQFWTASTRLASMMGVPWILFESPDQIVGQGQEGMRIALTTDDNKKKLVLAHYLNVLNDQDKAIGVTEQAIREIESNNWDDLIGMVDDDQLVKSTMRHRHQWSAE